MDPCDLRPPACYHYHRPLGKRECGGHAHDTSTNLTQVIFVHYNYYSYLMLLVLSSPKNESTPCTMAENNRPRYSPKRVSPMAVTRQSNKPTLALDKTHKTFFDLVPPCLLLLLLLLKTIAVPPAAFATRPWPEHGPYCRQILEK